MTTHYSRTPAITALLAFSLAILLSSHAFGQEPEAPASEPEVNATPAAAAAQPPAGPASAAGGANEAGPPDEAQASDDAAEDQRFREQTIYVPFDDLRDVFEKQGRGVFLPYEKFQDLWRRARAAEVPRPETGPPTGALLAEINSEAVVEADVVVVKARLRIELLARGWQRIPLRLADAAIRSARIGNQPAQITYDPAAGYQLLVRNQDEQARQIELELEYAKAFAKSPGQNSVSFQAPQAPINRWRIRVPQSGVKVNVHPLIAATEVPPEVDQADGNAEDESAETPDDEPDADDPADAPAEDPEADDAAPAEDGAEAGQPPARDETVVLAFVGAAPNVRIDWTPKAEGASGLAALATVLARQEVTIEEGVVRTRTHLSYTISRAELERLVIEVPADQKVTGVFDPNIRGWEVADGEETQQITIDLFQPARGTQNVSLELERFADDDAMRELGVPVVRAVDVARQQGFVVVRLAEGAELRMKTAERRGLVQVDRSDLPGELKEQQWPLAFRYATVPFVLSLQVEKLVPRIQADQLVEAVLTPNELKIDQLVILDIQRAGVFQLQLSVPEGFDIRVMGRAAVGAEAAVVDTFHQQDDDPTQLVVNLARKAIGRTGLLVRLKRSLDDLNLLSPTGESSEIPLALPGIVTPLEQFRGRLIVYAPESLRVNPKQTDGIRPVSLGEALKGSESVRDSRQDNARSVLAFAYALEPVTFSLDVQRRRPQITVRQLLAVGVEEGVVKYNATFFYEILYSGVPSLAIDIPAELADQINNVSNSIRESVPAPQPDDVPDGYIRWNFARGAELLGSVVIGLNWERKLDDLAVGAGVDIPVPSLSPIGTDRSWGQIVVAKAETLDVRTTGEVTGLRPIDPQHDLMAGAAATDAARAFEFQDEWSLTLTVTRFDLEEVKRTSIERAVLRTVVTRSDRISVQALYQLRSAVQRLAVRLPDEAELDNDPLRINGQSKGLEQGEDDMNFIPLADQSADAPLLVELRYTVEGNQREIGFPVFPAQPPLQSAPAMQKVHLCVYLPKDRRLLKASGPWTNEQDSWPPKWVSLTNNSDDDLLEWVNQGVGVDLARLKSFPTDGQLFRFTGLRPPAPPEGALRLLTVRERWLNGMLFGSLALVALLFWRQSAATKLMVLAAIVVAIVLAGVFYPTFAMQILNEYLLVACGLVIVVWSVAELVRRLRGPQPPPTQPGTPPDDDELTMVDLGGDESPFSASSSDDRVEGDDRDALEAPPDDGGEQPPAEGGERNA